jgi:hypothetical protein
MFIAGLSSRVALARFRPDREYYSLNISLITLIILCSRYPKERQKIARPSARHRRPEERQWGNESCDAVTILETFWWNLKRCSVKYQNFPAAKTYVRR